MSGSGSDTDNNERSIRKRKKTLDSRKQNQTKCARVQGLEYVNTVGKAISKKTAEDVE